MKGKNRILAVILSLAAIAVLCVVLFIIGRGHTVYFDNKTLEADGQVYEAPYQIQVFVDDESVCKLKEGDRGMVPTMGQNFSMVLHITREKDGKKTGSAVSLKLPYSMDGIIINLPALLGGADESAYMEEFIPAAVEEDPNEEVIVTDEFELPPDE